MYVLGIGGYFHDASACLLRDGQLVAAAEEERFTRLKHQPGFPHRAIDFCLRQADITHRDLDHVAFYMKPWLHFERRLWHHLKAMPQLPVYSTGYLVEQLYRRGWFLFELNRLKQLGGGRPKISFVKHHDSHAASAFFVSPFDRAAILILDGLGEWSTVTLGVGEGTRIRTLQETFYPHSIGALYGSVTNYLGFKTGDEYKVMGLASFGKPTELAAMRDLVVRQRDGSYRLNLSYFTFHIKPGRYEGYVSKQFVDRFGPPRQAHQPLEARHLNLAASVQALLEEVAINLATTLHQRTGAENLCVAGGVALNGVMNYRLAQDTPFKNVYVQPAANDSGTSLGAAFFLQHQVLNQPRRFVMEHAYWGPEYDALECGALLEETKTPYQQTHDAARAAAELIAAGKIVGWFNGRMEWGPRALGSRSILADPTRANMTELVNRFVKHREDFRPFAPSVLDEYGAEYFEHYRSSPFMLEVFPATALGRERIPAVVHVDGTSRVQTVSREVSPAYWQLIDEFRQITGVPVVLNTSFNVRGEPIVTSPRDALRCFYSTGMDALVLGNYVVDKKWVPRSATDLAPSAVADLDVLVG
jgi:carbamoyltransferase